ncbi:MAG: COQ9 family protein [Rickettsiaceae bacterium]
MLSSKKGCIMSNVKAKHQKLKIMFFQKLLASLETNNWSERIIKDIELELDVTLGYYHILFPNGLLEIVSSFEEWLDHNMIEQLKTITRPTKIRDQIALALVTRIINISAKNVALNTCSFLWLPSNIAAGFKINGRTCDVIWRYAGDKSTDFNYYSKRGLLLGVYKAAQAFYFVDNSRNHQDTVHFIKNSLDRIINIASLKSKIKWPNKEDVPIIRLFS